MKNIKNRAISLSLALCMVCSCGTAGFQAAAEETGAEPSHGKTLYSNNFEGETPLMDCIATPAGAYSAADGILTGIAEANKSALLTVDGGDWGDCVVTADVSASKEKSSSAGIVFRYRDAKNFYHLRLDAGKGLQQLQLFKWVDGEAGVLGDTPVVWDANTPYRLTAVMEGNAYKCYLNGDLMFSEADDSHTSGSVGFRIFGCTAVCDNLNVWALPDGEEPGPICPVATITAPTRNAVLTALPVVVTGTVEHAVSATITVDDGEPAKLDCGDGTFSHSLATLETGSHTVTVTAAGEGDVRPTVVECTFIFTPPVIPEGQTLYADDGTGYTEVDPALWGPSTLAGPDGHAARYSQDPSAKAKFFRYEMETPSGEQSNYEVSVWHPAGNTQGARARYTVQTGGGMWIRDLDQTQGEGWVKLAVIAVIGNTSTEIAVHTEEEGKHLYAGAVKLVQTMEAADTTSTPGSGTSTDPAILVNQVGYDYGQSKRATAVNIPAGTPFYLKDSTSKAVLYQGAVEKKDWSGTLYDGKVSKGEVRSVQGGIIDFSAFDPEERTDCYLECGTVVSFPFTIAKNWMQRVSLPSATDFMEQTRSDYGTDPGWLQMGWRDSHQFSYELPSLVLQYMSNPSYYNHLPYDVWRAEDCMFEELRIQTEPNIVWLMKFGMARYYDIRFNGDYAEPKKRPPEVTMGEKDSPWGNKKKGPQYLHSMIKEQMAYVLYLYPQISQWMSQEEYLKYRDFLLTEWGESRCSMQWHQVAGEKSNLFETQTVTGNIKGGFPPGHSIVPNLLMYEIIRRDLQDPGLITDTLSSAPEAQFFDAAYNNCDYVLKNFPIYETHYSKGQRMNEHIVMENLAWFQEMYPDRAPEALYDEIKTWAEKMIARSDNLWDVRMAASVSAGDRRDYWTGSAYDQQEVGAFKSALNEPGNAAGFQAATLAAARVLTEGPDTQARLRGLGVGAIDNMFGRNPYGRTYFYSCTRTVQEDGTPDYLNRNTDLVVPGHEQEIEGTDLGWMNRHIPIGSGVLGIVRGRIDASPKEWAYPYSPETEGGYNEGWVTYNTEWNSSLAYAAADGIRIEAEPVENNVGSITVTLYAPNNLDYEAHEFVDIQVTDLSTGEIKTLHLPEDGMDGLCFTGTWSTDKDEKDYGELEFSYGYGLFRRSDTGNKKKEEAVMGRLKVEAKKRPLAGETQQLTVTHLVYANGTKKELPEGLTLRYGTDDVYRAAVSPEGVVTAKRPGAVKVWAETDYEGITFKGEVALQVLEKETSCEVFEFEKMVEGVCAVSDHVTVSPGSEGKATAALNLGAAVVLFKPTVKGAWLQLAGLELEAGRYAVELNAKKETEYGYGLYQVDLNDTKLSEIDFGDATEGYAQHPLGTVELDGGIHTLKLTALDPQKPNCALNHVTFLKLGGMYPELDFSALTEAVAQAEALLELVRAGTDGKTYPEDKIAALELQLDLARLVLREVDRPGVEAIAAAVSALSAATQALQDAATHTHTYSNWATMMPSTGRSAPAAIPWMRPPVHPMSGT